MVIGNKYWLERTVGWLECWSVTWAQHTKCPVTRFALPSPAWCGPANMKTENWLWLWSQTTIWETPGHLFTFFFAKTIFVIPFPQVGGWQLSPNETKKIEHAAAAGGNKQINHRWVSPGSSQITMWLYSVLKIAFNLDYRNLKGARDASP